jgi:hypothetical protein
MYSEKIIVDLKRKNKPKHFVNKRAVSYLRHP